MLFKRLLYSNGGVDVSLNKQVERVLLDIPSNANVFVGGYLTKHVPNALLNILRDSKAHQLTVITNASVLQNPGLRSLFNLNGKVKRLVTSLESNRNAILSREVNGCFEINLLDTNKFMKRYSHQGYASESTGGECALIRSDSMDHEGNLYWNDIKQTYFNDLFAKLTSGLTVSQSDRLTNVPNASARSRLDKFYVNFSGVFNHGTVEKATNDDDDDPVLDRRLEIMVKRLVLELYHNDTIFMSKNIYKLMSKFYMPRHINLNLLNEPLDMNWPSNAEWLSLARKINVCVVQARGITRRGELELNNLHEDDCKMIDVLNHSSSGDHLKLIALLKIDRHTKVDGKSLKTADHLQTKLEDVAVIRKRPHVIITNIGVFKFNAFMDRYVLVEYFGDDLANLNEHLPFEPLLHANLSTKILL